MVTYYLYRLVNSLIGDKVGATKRWDGRHQDNREVHGQDCIITELETMEGPDTPEYWQVVGDREWELADEYGYPRGTHYKIARENFSKVTFEARSKGGTTAGNLNVLSGHWESLRTVAHQTYAGKRGGAANVAAGNIDKLVESAQTPEARAKSKKTRLKNMLIKYNSILDQLPNQFTNAEYRNVTTRKIFDRIKDRNLVVRVKRGLYAKA